MNILNAARRISAMFPGYFQNAKHDHNKDFGYPIMLILTQLISDICVTA